MRALRLASFIDRQESRARRVAERFGYAPWLDEFKAYLGDPRMTLEEFWVRYTLLRMQEVPTMRAVTTDAEARHFLETSEYPLWRNLVHRRHAAWRRVLWTMKGERGEFLEFGCGVAPVAAWVAAHRWPHDGWHYHLVDLAGPARHFAQTRILQWMLFFEPEAYWSGSYHVMTALDVFEHLPDPEKVTRDLVERLAPGGYLHWNFIETDSTELDRATPAQREATIRYLRSSLRLVYEEPGYCVSRKE